MLGHFFFCVMAFDHMNNFWFDHDVSLYPYQSLRLDLGLPFEVLFLSGLGHSICPVYASQYSLFLSSLKYTWNIFCNVYTSEMYLTKLWWACLHAARTWEHDRFSFLKFPIVISYIRVDMFDSHHGFHFPASIHEEFIAVGVCCHHRGRYWKVYCFLQNKFH